MQPVGVRVARQGLPVDGCGLRWWDAVHRRSWCSTAAAQWGTAVNVIVRERRRVTSLGVAVALLWWALFCFFRGSLSESWVSSWDHQVAFVDVHSTSFESIGLDRDSLGRCRGRHTLKKIISAAITAVAALALALPAQASAVTYTDYQVNGALIRSAADGLSRTVGAGYIGQGATLYCGRFGRSTSGPASTFWIYHRNNRTGVQGFTAGQNIRGQINNLPRC